MKGVYLPGNAEAHVKEWPDPVPGEGEVLLEVKASALCGSDMTIYHGEPLVGSTPAGAVIPGHEPCGIVREVGKGVSQYAPGDRVAVICFDSCGHCRYCRTGEPNLCPEVKFVGLDRHGGDAELLAVPEKTCLPIPHEMSYVLGAISTDALGNLYSTMKEMSVSGEDVVGVVGLGPMGLSGVLAAKGMGATVVAIDPVQARLNKAKELGADYIVNPENEDVQEAVAELTRSEGVHKSVDCSGVAGGISIALDMVRRHGVVAQIGETSNRTVSVRPSDQLIHKKVTWFGSWYFKLEQWPDIVDFVMGQLGDGRAEQIVSHRCPLEEAAVSEVFRLFDEHQTFKVVFVP